MVQKLNLYLRTRSEHVQNTFRTRSEHVPNTFECEHGSAAKLFNKLFKVCSFVCVFFTISEHVRKLL